jgi:hypothetical protein
MSLVPAHRPPSSPTPEEEDHDDRPRTYPAYAEAGAGTPEWLANAPFPTSSIIGLDHVHEGFTMLCSDARDVFRVHRTDIVDGVWRQWREAPGFDQRYTGVLADATITGFSSADGETWRKDFDLDYRRVP